MGLTRSGQRAESLSALISVLETLLNWDQEQLGMPAGEMREFIQLGVAGWSIQAPGSPSFWMLREGSPCSTCWLLLPP